MNSRRTLFGLGGYDETLPNNNVLEVETLEQDTSGTWCVVVRDGAGNETSRRQATDEEITPAKETEPVPVESDVVAELRAQLEEQKKAAAAQAEFLRLLMAALPVSVRQAMEATANTS